jgi:hypothetical protein
MTRLGASILFIALCLVALALIRKPHGTARHQLLVNTAAVANPDPAMPAWRLWTLCPTRSRNIPIIDEQETV